MMMACDTGSPIGNAAGGLPGRQCHSGLEAASITNRRGCRAPLSQVVLPHVDIMCRDRRLCMQAQARVLGQAYLREPPAVVAVSDRAWCL